MNNQLTVFCAFIIIFSQNLVYGQQYSLEVEENSFEIHYDFKGVIIEMAIDHELTSLLIATKNVEDTLFQIEIPKELISAENNEFAVLVNGFEVEYEITSDNNISKLSFYIPTDTEEIEIIGTQVIPEFPFGVIFSLLVLISLVTIITKSKLRIIK